MPLVNRHRLVLATALCLSLSAGAISLATAPSIATVRTTLASSRATIAQQGPADDADEALARAKASKKDVEDLSQRTEASQTYARPDGTWRTRSTPSPMRVQADDGSWHDIDTTLVETPEGLRPRYAAIDLTLSDGGDKTFAEVDDQEDKDLSFSWPTQLPKPIVDGDTATYPNAVPGGDLVVTAKPDGFTHNIVLNERPTAPLSMTIPIETDGAKLAKASDGAVSLETKSGDDVLSADKPLMYEGDAEVPPTNSVPVKTTLATQDADSATMTLTPDPKFLADPATTYPVTIDPTWRSYTYGGDSWAQSPTAASGANADPTLKIGRTSNNQVRRSFIKFDVVPWMGKHILSSTLNVWNNISASCGAQWVTARRITVPWASSNVGFNAAVTTENQGASAVSYDTSGCVTNAMTPFDITAMTQQWANGVPNYGVRLASDHEDIVGYAQRTYLSGEYSCCGYPAQTHPYRPYLEVTYNTVPAAPSTPVLSPEDTSAPDGSPQADNAIVASTMPTLSATATDPDGGTVMLAFEIATTSGGSPVATCSSAYVASGATASCTVSSATALTAGQTYFARARTFDGVDSSQWGASRQFNVNESVTDAPASTMTSYGVDQAELEDLQAASQVDGVSVQAEVDRYGWQAKFAQDVANVAAAYPDAYSGSAIDPTTSNGATVSFTGAVPTDVSNYFSNVPVPVTTSAGEPYTEVQQKSLVSSATDSIASQVSPGTPFTVAYNPANHRLEAVVTDSSASSSTQQAMVAHTSSDTSAANPSVSAPDVDIQFIPDAAVTTTTLRGGARLTDDPFNPNWACTSGFPVQVQGQQKWGLLTAEHCFDNLSAYGFGGPYPRPALASASKILDFKLGDIQYQASLGEDVGHSFYYRVGHYRTVGKVAHPTVGMRICMFGRYSLNNSTCSTIKKLNVGSNTENWDHAARTYKGLVAATTRMGVIKGDSGGPVFYGDNAIGIISGYGKFKGESTERMLFTPVDVIANSGGLGLYVNVP